MLRVPWIRWFPALVLLFFIAAAAVAPDATSDRIRAAEPDGTVGAVAAAGIAAQLGAEPTVAPTALPTAIPTNAPAPATIAAAPTATPPPMPTAPASPTIPAGPTPTPDRGAPGNAVPAYGTIQVPVLMYHYIRVNPNPRDSTGFGLSVTPADFAAQMEWLAENGYHAVLPSELRLAITEGAPLPTKPIAITFDDGYRDFYTAAWPVLKRLGLKSSVGVITAYADRGDIGDEMYMNWDMVREVDATGLVEIASHTQFHADLTRASIAQRWSEIAKSKEIIEQKLGHPCTSFIYPTGAFNDAVVADARRAGYGIAFTTRSGKVRAPQDGGNLLTLPRIRVSGGQSLQGFASNL